jgi:aminoglycoside phosphotransferase family enzyme
LNDRNDQITVRARTRDGRAVKTKPPPASACGSQEEKVEFLRDPRHYPDRPARVAVVETHFAWVFLTGRHAYKMKKPMRQASLDYRTIASRERACRNELRLNRRLAPTVYIAVVPLARRRNGELALGRGRSVVDWLVKMRRLSASRMLDRAIARRAVTSGDLASLTDVLAAFFGRARREPMTPMAYKSRLRARTRRNARDLRAPDLGLDRAGIDPVIRAQLDFIAGASDLLGARGAKLIEGHGDLRPEHVWLGPRPLVIDCLEFDPGLRRLDPAEEMAFLALECARLGASRIGEDLLQRYRAAMQDPVPDALMQFYLSQRAATRAKIAAWHLRDPRYRRRQWLTRANSYLEDARRCARLALRGIERESPLFVRRKRPAAQQRSERLARQHAPHGLAKQRADGQRNEPVARSG